MISRGEFGIKTGKGFWEWSETQTKAERKRYAKALKAALAILQEEDAG
jgi:3-hydroxybutyryl-CoA dehydrogenase